MKKIMRVLLVLTIAVLLFNLFVFREEMISLGTYVFGYVMPLIILGLFGCANAPLDDEEDYDEEGL